jgi:hypothetical protein
MKSFPAPIDHCYILCDPEKEPDRAKYLMRWFMDHVDPSKYTFYMPTYGTDPMFQTDAIWKFYNPWSRTLRNFNSPNLKPGELSLLFNFAMTARKAIQAGHSVIMILESDVLFSDNFLEKLEQAMKALPTQWDFLSLSASVGLVPRRTPADVGRLWFPPIDPYFHTRCTDSMIFRVSMLEKILGTFFPCAEALDWELNYQLTRHGSHSWWLDPPILRQGSGKEYQTTL